MTIRSSRWRDIRSTWHLRDRPETITTGVWKGYLLYSSSGAGGFIKGAGVIESVRVMWFSLVVFKIWRSRCSHWASSIEDE